MMHSIPTFPETTAHENVTRDLHTHDCDICAAQITEISRVIAKISELVDSITTADIAKAKANPMLGMLLGQLTKTLK